LSDVERVADTVAFVAIFPSSQAHVRMLCLS